MLWRRYLEHGVLKAVLVNKTSGPAIAQASVLRIHDILGVDPDPADPYLSLMYADSDPDADLDPAIFVIDLPKMPTKN
jgi:hypothetical protein